MENKRKIVFVNQACGFITIDIINAFAPVYQTAVIFGDIREQDVPLHPDVRTSKIIEKSRKSNLLRFIRWFIASIQIFILLATKYRKYEIFYFSVPPFAYFSSLLLKRKYSILMWDVYPDALKIVGVTSNNIIYQLWVRINKYLFSKAYKIYTIAVSYTHLRAHETVLDLVCRLLLEKKKQINSILSYTTTLQLKSTTNNSRATKFTYTTDY